MKPLASDYKEWENLADFVEYKCERLVLGELARNIVSIFHEGIKLQEKMSLLMEIRLDPNYYLWTVS